MAEEILKMRNDNDLKELKEAIKHDFEVLFCRDESIKKKINELEQHIKYLEYLVENKDKNNGGMFQ